ncbi:MAG: HAMP domain-containing histidine kinase [Xanthomonadales bacterium]|nr:HAMP domain-containing histidine kinase [Xanthomonadales bacterium]
MADVAGSAAGRRQDLRRRIRAAFFLQIAAIGMATVLGVYGAYFVLEDLLIRRALSEEAAHYLERLQRDPQAALPDTYNMRGYLSPPRAVDPPLPAELQGMSTGFRNVPMAGRTDIVSVSDTPHGRLYLVFAQEQVNRLALFFGFVPLSFVLVAIYLIVWMTYRASKRAVSPVIWLASKVRAWDPKQPTFEDLSPDRLPPDAEGEVEVLAGAMRTFAERNQAFVQRERNFTRDASHELRSPLTVIKIACDVLLGEDGLTPFAERNLQRIRRSARDMEALIESFLILARESDTGLPEEDFLANEVVLEEVENARAGLADRPVVLRVEQRAQLRLHAPPRVFGVVVGNLIRNACQYTERGEVVVTIDAGSIEVADTGIGMAPDELDRVFEPFFRSERASGRSGHGIGLTIVRRLSDRFGWQVSMASEQDRGTRVGLRFPDALHD